jgi:hypothetical protein
MAKAMREGNVNGMPMRGITDLAATGARLGHQQSAFEGRALEWPE